MLCELDPDFLELFKVQADFDDRMDRTPESDALYARLIGTLARRAEERPLDATAVARVIEQAARLAGDAEKVSTHMRSLTNLLREADRWADEAGHETVTADDVDRAVDAQRQRAGRIRDRMLEEVGRGTILIETSGEAIGQVNGLSVVQIGEAAFGQPSRITARARLGRGEVVDIEREVALGGPIHSKGVLILTGFLGGRYARRRPLALQASLVFEQSYGGVDGDSASLAEACALLSAVGQVPLRQSLAVTGSIDQQGNVQPVGGVDEKLEGFHDVCERRGWRGGEGVIIPAANVRNLMLRRDVVESAAAGRFRVYAVRTADEALELLTGMPAGAPDADGQYPPDSVNGRVAAALAELAEQARAFSTERSAQDQSHSER
jgi:lon-related putative ATP-dependent protease